MSDILVITHPYDGFIQKDPVSGGYGSRFLLSPILAKLMERGHRFKLTNGIPDRPVRADAAIVHVDATLVPAEYLEYAASFPVCLNREVQDISKRLISGARILENDPWQGPVIVKSNLNCHGKPEIDCNEQADRRGQPLPFPQARLVKEYSIYESLADVPENSRADPALILDKFIPEPDPGGYAIRFWVFCGDREHCNRIVSNQRLVKGASAVSRHAAPVPESLRLKRKELGFDYGKFDFVIHEGQAVLLDANKTPANPPDFSGDLQQNIANLADGFESMLTGRAASR
jgi:hypothetical protein